MVSNIRLCAHYFGLVLFSSLPFATFSVVFLFGILMMVGGVLHLIAALSVFKGGSRWLWALLECCI